MRHFKFKGFTNFLATLMLIFGSIFPLACFAQATGNADIKYVMIKSMGSGSYSFSQFDSFAGAASGAPNVQELKTWPTYTLQSVTSDGERWYAILKRGTQNCFVIYSSYEHMMNLKGGLLRCNENVPNNSFRGLAYDGKLFYTISWDGTQHWWQTYQTWEDLVDDLAYNKLASKRTGSDIYKSIGFDPIQKVFFSTALNSAGKLFLNKYATFNDMVAVRPNADVARVYTSDQHVGMAIGPVNPTLDLYVVAGQSNAIGWGTDGAQLAPDAGDADIKFFYRIGDRFDTLVSTSESVTTLQPQTAAFRMSPPTVFGIEMGMARTLRAAGRTNMAIVKVAYGGTDLYSQWNPNTANSLLRILQDNISTASIQWNQAGYRVRIAGFFWMQGEWDAKDPTKAAAYLTNLRQLVATARAVSGNEYLPFVVGRITPNWPYATTVRAAQDQLATEDAYVRVVNSDDLPKSDSAHYNSAGEYTLGSRMGSAYRSIVGW